MIGGGGSVELPVLGIKTRFATNSDDVLASVDDAFGGWRLLDDALVDRMEPLRVDIHVGGDVTTDERIVVRHSCPDATRLVVHSAACIGVSDPLHRDAVVYVAPSLVADRFTFRETVLQALTFALLSHFDRHPIHAAAVSREGRAVLLAGPSGTGKSTLAHRAHVSGLTVLHDDHVWVQRSPQFRVWGAPGHARLATDDDARPKDSPIPKDAKRLVELEGARHDPTAYTADRATVCLVQRSSDGRATLERVNAEAIVEELTNRVDPGFDRFPDRHGDVVAALAHGGGWRLTLSDDPRDALPLLLTMLESP